MAFIKRWWWLLSILLLVAILIPVALLWERQPPQNPMELIEEMMSEDQVEKIMGEKGAKRAAWTENSKMYHWNDDFLVIDFDATLFADRRVKDKRLIHVDTPWYRRAYYSLKRTIPSLPNPA